MGALENQVNQNTSSLQALIDESKNANELPELNIPIQDDDVFIVRANGVTYHVNKSALKDVLKGEVTLLSFIENILSIGVDGQETPLSVDLSSLDQTEEIKELSEIPSGLTMFELKDGKLYLSVDGEMPKKVDLTTIASEVKTVKLTITAAEIEASLFVGNPNPPIPINIVPAIDANTAFDVVSVYAKIIPIAGGGYDDIGMVLYNYDVAPGGVGGASSGQFYLYSVFGFNLPVGVPFMEKGYVNPNISPEDGRTYYNFGQGLNLFANSWNGYSGADIDLIVNYREITF